MHCALRNKLDWISTRGLYSLALRVAVLTKHGACPTVANVTMRQDGKESRVLDRDVLSEQVAPMPKSCWATAVSLLTSESEATFTPHPLPIRLRQVHLTLPWT
jgi:hypothetical protein